MLDAKLSIQVEVIQQVNDDYSENKLNFDNLKEEVEKVKTQIRGRQTEIEELNSTVNANKQRISYLNLEINVMNEKLVKRDTEIHEISESIEKSTSDISFFNKEYVRLEDTFRELIRRCIN